MRTLLLALALCMAITLQLGCTAGESRYGNPSELERASAGEREWLPKTLPPTSRDIAEWHDLDTNRSFGRLEFARSEEALVRATLTRVPDGQRIVVRTQWIDPDWWPSELAGEVDQTRLQQRGLELFKDTEYLYAIDWRQGVMYFWHGSR